MICVVSYWNCHILVEDDDRDPLNPEEVLHEISHTSMLEFCRQLRDDIRANLEQWVRFVDYHEEDLEEKRLRLEQKLAELDTLIAAREESFDERPLLPVSQNKTEKERFHPQWKRSFYFAVSEWPEPGMGTELFPVSVRQVRPGTDFRTGGRNYVPKSVPHCSGSGRVRSRTLVGAFAGFRLPCRVRPAQPPPMPVAR